MQELRKEVCISIVLPLISASTDLGYISGRTAKEEAKGKRRIAM
jgi:hypothetical protein